MKASRTLVILAAGTILAGLVRQYAGGLARVPAIAGLLLPFRAALLMTEPPDACLSMPLEKMRVDRIASTWQASRPGGRRHEGQDLFAPRGTPVVSATRGIVVRIGSGGLGGNTVSVLGSGGRIYYYAHLWRFEEGLQTGAEVTPRSVLGYVGNSGNARTTPPHLHFGVYTRAGAVDPLPLLTARGIRTIPAGGLLQ